MESLHDSLIAHWDQEPSVTTARRKSVLDCGSLLPLSRVRAKRKSARGLAQSKTWRLFRRFMESLISFFPPALGP